MNKIYKVIWSKVKNQYVVVSELAHSSGKQSRTSRSSIRSRIAALVVCGAIAAFGVLPMNSAFANEGATITDNDTYFDGVWWDNHETSYTINGQNGITVSQDNSKDIIIGLKPGQGISVSNETGVSIELSKGEGLKFNSNKLAVDAGDGLSTESGHLAVKLAKTGDNDNSGLTVDTNGLKINNGDTLKINNNQLDVNLADNSLTADTTGLKVNAGDGLTAKDANGNDTALSVKTGAGLKIDESNKAVAVNVGTDSGLTADAESGLAIKLNKGSDTNKNISGLTVTSDGLKVNAGNGLSTETGQLAVKLDGKSLSASEDGLKVNAGAGLKIDTNNGDTVAVNVADTSLTADTTGLKVKVKANSGLDTTTDGLAVKLDGKSLSASEDGLKVNAGAGLKIDTNNGDAVAVNVADTSLTADTTGLKVKVKANSGLDTTTDGLAVKLVEANSGLATDGGLHVNTGAGLSTESGQLAVKLAEEDSGLKIEDGALSIDKDALNMGSTNVKAGTNIEVKNGVVSLKSDVTLDADANDGNKDGKKIYLSGTKGTINAVNTTKSEPQYGWDGIKTTTTTNTFDFSDGGKFVTEKNENTVVKNLKGKITSERDLVTTNTTEFNEKGATFSKVETDKGWKKKFLFGKDTWDTTTNSSTNIDGGKITLSSDARKDDKNVVIDGTAGEMTGLSNTKWDARKAANGSYESSNKAATEAQLQGVYNTAEDAYDTAKDAYDEAGKHTTVKLSDKNLTLEERPNAADGTEYTLGLNPVVTLDGTKYDGDGIVLNGESGSIHAVNTQAAGIVGPFGEHIAGVSTNKFDFDNDGAKFEAKVSGTIGHIADNVTLSTTKTTKFDEHGATFVNKKEAKRTILGQTVGKLTDVSFTNIDGGVVTTDIVKGLNNTKWDDKLADAVDKSKRLQGMAATQGQLRDVDIKVNENTQAIEENADDIGALKGEVDKVGQGWTVSDENSGTKDFNVKPGETLKFNGDKNIDVTAADGAINVGLKPVVTLGGDTEDSNKVVLDGENGTINAVNITKDAYGHGSPTITNTFSFDKNGVNLTNTKETGGDKGAGKTTTNTFNFDENGATFTETVERKKPGKIDSTVTRINGGTITTDTVKGLNNTEWKANSVVENRAATEGQLKDVYTEATKHTTVELADGEENLILNEEDTVNGKEYTLGLNGDLNVTSITTGNTKLDSNGLTIAGTKYVSSTGLNAGNKVISNVADGEKGTDAVNVSQLEAVKTTANKGWTAKASDGGEITVKPGKTLNFNGDGNIDVTATSMWGNNAINIGLKPVVTLDGDKPDGDGIVLNGESGSINAKNSKIDVKKDYEWKWGPIIPSKVTTTTTTTSNKFNFDENGGKFVTTEAKSESVKTWGDYSRTDSIVTHTAGFNGDGATFTKEEGIWPNKEISSTNIDGGTVTTDTVKGLSNTTWDAQNPNAYANSDKAATEAQLQKATAASKTTVSAGDNIKVDSTQNNDGHIDYKVSLKDNITLDGTAGHINFNPDNGNNMISIKDTTGDTVFNVANNGTVSSDGDVIADADGEKYSLSEVGKYAVRYDDNNGIVNKGKITLDGPNGTTIANVADAKKLDEAVNLGQLQTTEKHIATNVTTNEGKSPETNDAYAVDKDGKITLTEVDGAGKETGNKVVLSNIASIDALEAVEATANKGWTAKVGTEEIDVKPGKTLNFNGDENITVSATTSEAGDNAINVKLNDNITLGDKTNTSLTLYTDSNYAKDSDGNFIKDSKGNYITGYVPESYQSGTGLDFVKNYGGFSLFATDTQGHGIFGVTTKGTVHGRDFVTYTKDIYNYDTQYSLNEIGNAVSQMTAYYDKEKGKTYTVFSHYLNEADKENPFEVVGDDGKVDTDTRDISLALRDDGAVLIGATVEGDSFTETGIRINENDSQMITGLSNTTWTPTVNKRIRDGETPANAAATVGQLNDLYDTVVGYNAYTKEDNTVGIDYDHITLKGTDYEASTDANGVKTYSGGTSINNVAYATTDTTSKEYDGSAAVNVDLLKDTIAGVKAETNTDVGDLNFSKVEGTVIEDGKDNVTTAIGKLDNKVGDLNYSKAEGTVIEDGKDDLTTAIGKLDNKIDSIGGTATNADNDTITGGKIDAENGTISLTQKDKGTINLEGKFTDSEVTGVSLEKDATTGKNTLKITSTDKYSKETSSVSVSGLEIASTDDIKDVAGATSSDELKEKYKDTAYLKDENGETVGTLADADVALDRTVQNIASNFETRMGNVERRLGDVEQRIDKVGAMAAAIANLRTMGFDPEAPTEIAVGVGQYKSETGLAIGVFHYPNQDFMLSASLSTSGDEVMGGIGATWRIGRKTAAEKAKDEEKRILAKAEEIKQAAKRAEVKAQADRHAKLLAEREAKGESIRPIENKVEQTQEQA